MRRVLIDTGPLVALFNRRDAHHAEVTAWLRNFDGELVSCWSVLTEVCHLIPEHLIATCLQWAGNGGLGLTEIPPSALGEIARLAGKYNDRPMDLADASLIWLAGRYDLHEILTLDHNDFAVYRTMGGWAMKDLLLFGPQDE